MDYENARSPGGGALAIDLDAPLWQQYADYIWNLLHFNLGVSITSPGTPVSAIIARFLPWTIFSVGIGLTFSFVFGILLGDDGLPPRGVSRPRTHGLCVGRQFDPNYLIGILLVVWLGVQWKICPLPKSRHHVARHDAVLFMGISFRRALSCLPADLDLCPHDDRHLDAQHERQHRRHAGRGLRHRGGRGLRIGASPPPTSVATLRCRSLPS